MVVEQAAVQADPVAEWQGFLLPGGPNEFDFEERVFRPADWQVAGVGVEPLPVHFEPRAIAVQGCATVTGLLDGGPEAYHLDAQHSLVGRFTPIRRLQFWVPAPIPVRLVFFAQTPSTLLPDASGVAHWQSPVVRTSPRPISLYPALRMDDGSWRPIPAGRCADNQVQSIPTLFAHGLLCTVENLGKNKARVAFLRSVSGRDFVPECVEEVWPGQPVTVKLEAAAVKRQVVARQEGRKWTRVRVAVNGVF